MEIHPAHPRARSPRATPKIGSLGKPALHPDRRIPFAELRGVNVDGTDVPDGEVGELLVRTPMVMKGYYRDPEQTAAALQDGWFMTGDLVRRDADGFYHFVARKKDIIRRRGENIAGADLDRVLGEHPGVAEAAAIAVPSELGEDEILVAVVARADAELTAQDIGAWCTARLALPSASLRSLRGVSSPHADASRGEVRPQTRPEPDRARSGPAGGERPTGVLSA